ncbi:tachykinin-like peptides receptor 86C [Actinia tenebrosa]|uniref:Tachykinin-like peptides receptor 86C n=1 Tax=Actinia tenebrosa TaxID=6105 RepID=A0A6P8HDV4_ACTTE|nr:tachykinin-like peptides receptor 86C [Actinia tenebrosa]XP_031550758.1 tachykinin-like peptides receptor 86C [Actinia tenebrosa]XP_031550766.1 tachykinin-like peptides receptor 86C [Actinia tenebrosa]XP_031550773.1 tachykinin-like peptides receptor 86C [Actinia tenebrosa]XP_031550781.1 tachykinin-like peptides receptor 86C [Actinia tenebrosa]XP_031550789.1 tachykinin-like peptides receptor 86C [Actinia tenebrosa]XP_031550795.1 tachykinin-like peptides receptor 86C [Actinia tenebrosa]
MTINNTSDTMDTPPRSQGTMWTVAFGFEAFVIVVANSLTVAVFATGRQMRKRSTYCLINLSMADLLVGAVPMPMWVYLVGAQYQLWEFSWDIQSWNKVYFPIDQICAFASIFCLVLLSLERIYATIAPLQHRRMSGGCYAFAISFVWLFSCTISLSSYMSLSLFNSRTLSTYIPMTALCISVILLCIAYSSIWVSFRWQRFDTGFYNGRAMLFERKLVKTLFIVTAASLTAWLPFVIVSTAVSLHDVNVDFSTVLAVKMLHYTNSLINPIIYTFRMRNFRRALFGLLKTRLITMSSSTLHIPLETQRQLREKCLRRLGSSDTKL